MLDLSRTHIRLLTQIKKDKVIRVSKPNKDLDYLYELGYIEITQCDKPNDYYAQPYLTEKGMARLDAERRYTLEKWIPIIISLIALVKSFIPEILWLTSQVMQLLK